MKRASDRNDDGPLDTQRAEEDIEETSLADLQRAVWTLAEQSHHPEQFAELFRELSTLLADPELSAEELAALEHAVAVCLLHSPLPQVYADLLGKLPPPTPILPLVKARLEACLAAPPTCFAALRAWALLAERAVLSPNGLPEYVLHVSTLLPTEFADRLGPFLLSLPLPTAMDLSAWIKDASLLAGRPHVEARADCGLPLETSILMLSGAEGHLLPPCLAVQTFHVDSELSAYQQWLLSYELVGTAHLYGLRNHGKCCEFLHLIAAHHVGNDQARSVKAVQNVLFSLLLWGGEDAREACILPATLLVGGCRHAKAFAPALAQLVKRMVCDDGLVALSFAQVTALAHWFALHLAHFECKWPWSIWQPKKADNGSKEEGEEPVEEEPAWLKTPQCRLFFVESLQELLRVSYHDHLVQVLPDYLTGKGPSTISLLGPLPKPVIEVSVEDALIGQIKSKQPIDADSVDPGHLVKCLLVVGSKTSSHANAVWERHGEMVAMFIQQGKLTAHTLLDTCFDFWRLHAQNFELTVEMVLRLKVIADADVNAWFCSTLSKQWSKLGVEELVRRLLRPEFLSMLSSEQVGDLRAQLSGDLVDVDVQQMLQLALPLQ